MNKIILLFSLLFPSILFAQDNMVLDVPANTQDETQEEEQLSLEDREEFLDQQEAEERSERRRAIAEERAKGYLGVPYPELMEQEECECPPVQREESENVEVVPYPVPAPRQNEEDRDYGRNPGEVIEPFPSERIEEAERQEDLPGFNDEQFGGTGQIDKREGVDQN